MPFTQRMYMIECRNDAEDSLSIDLVRNESSILVRKSELEDVGLTILHVSSVMCDAGFLTDLSDEDHPDTWTYYVPIGHVLYDIDTLKIIK